MALDHRPQFLVTSCGLLYKVVHSMAVSNEWLSEWVTWEREREGENVQDESRSFCSDISFLLSYSVHYKWVNTCSPYSRVGIIEGQEHRKWGSMGAILESAYHIPYSLLPTQLPETSFKKTFEIIIDSKDDILKYKSDHVTHLIKTFQWLPNIQSPYNQQGPSWILTVFLSPFLSFNFPFCFLYLS